MSLPRLSIRRPIAVAMLFLGVALLGTISFQRLPIDLLPDVAYPRLVIHTTLPGSAPAEIERFVSERVEQAVGAVPGMQEVESVSREGISLVTVRFAWGTDMDFAALNVREKLDAVADNLPQQASRPTVLRLDPRSEPIMALSVAGDAPLPELKELAEQVLRRRLEQIDGVAQAAVTGGLDREIQVEVDAQRMEAFGVTLDAIDAALKAANASAPGGTVRQGRYRYSLRTLGEFETVEQINAVPLRAQRTAADSLTPASGLLLSDVATVTDGFRERESIARFNGQESVGMLIFKDAGENTVRVAALVEETLEQLRGQYPGLRLEIATSQATFVADAIDNVVQNLVQGGALAFLVLLLFLRDVRYPVAIGLAIPISVIGAFVLMDAFGVTLNVMSLGGLALGVGMLVDNSIVVLENTFRHRELGLGSIESATRGAEEVQGAITASTLTTIAVFGPIVYIEGVAGELFGSLSLAVAFSLLASIFVALTLLPTLAARFGRSQESGVRSRESGVGSEESGVRSRESGVGRREPGVRGQESGVGMVGHPAEAVSDPAAISGDGDPHGDLRAPKSGGWAQGRMRLLAPFRRWGSGFDRSFARFAAWYEGMLLLALEHRRRVLTVALGMLLLTIVVGWRLDRRFLPVVDQGEFSARVELARGTPLERTEETARQLEQLFLADPAVAAVFTSVGHREAIAGLERDETGLHTARVDVRLHEGESTDEVLERVRPGLGFLPEGSLAIESGDATAIGRLLGGGESDLAVRVRGEDADASLAYAAELESRLAALPSIENVRMGTRLGQPEMRIEIDRERAASHGIEPARISDAITGYMSGTMATEYVDFDRKIPVIVRLPDQDRRSLEMLRSLRVDGVPIRDLVQVQTTLGPTEIRREGQARLIPVYADVRSGGLEEAIADIEAVLRSEPPPAGLRVEVGGEREEMQRSFRELGFAFGLALLLVFMILAAEFENFLHPFVILLSVPMGLVGAVLALWVTGSGFNTMSLIGIVVLAGIVDNDAVVKVDFINQMRRNGLPLREAIVAAGHARLRPILMTTLTTLLGLLPMAVAGGRGAELRAPLAIAVFGGLFSATALTLIVLPVLYEAMEEGRSRALAWVRGSGASSEGAAESRREPLVPAQGD